MIFYGGNVLTVNSKNEVVDAVAVKDGKIIAVGDKKPLLSLADKHTRLINLNHQTLVPGFIAVHEHPTLTAVFINTIDVSGFSFKTPAQMWQHLQQEINKKDSDEWIYAMGLDPVLMPDLILPNIKKLDEMAPNQPLVIISQTMHSFWANSKAFEEAGITKNTPDPGHGSYYGRDKQGKLNGFISEADAAQPFLKELQSPLSVVGRYEQTLQNLVNSGYTTVVSAGFNLPSWLAKYASWEHFSPRIRQFVYLIEKELDQLPDSPDNGNDFYKVLGIKLWYDGSPYTGTMALEQPYLDNPLTRMMGMGANHQGKLRISPEKFSQLLTKYANNGWQFAIHSQGDRACKLAVDQIQNSLGLKAKPLRIRLEHTLLIKKETLEKMQGLMMTPSFHINHILYYGDALSEKIIGPVRAQKVLPLKTAFDLKLHPTIHADSPMFPAAPFRLMKTALMRTSRTGKILGKDEAITIRQALRAITINAAWQIHMDNKLGSLEIGKYADFTILDKNPYETKAENWNSIKVKQVWLQGKQQSLTN